MKISKWDFTKSVNSGAFSKYPPDWLLEPVAESHFRFYGHDFGLTLSNRRATRYMWKIRHHEFWNTHLFHLPVYFYWLWLSIKSRSPFFFSAANPGIENGGLIGESKYNILRRIHPDLVPKTLFYQYVPSAERAIKDLTRRGMSFPFVVKPDVGQGGWMIDLIHNETELENFLAGIQMSFMIQEYVDAPIELGVLYYRMPGEAQGSITSIATKEFLHVKGDGQRTIRELMELNPRANNGHMEKLLKLNRHMKMDRIPEKAERVPLSFIGNHSYGTTYLNAAELITPALNNMFDRVCHDIDGFYFGRFDIRCNSLSDFHAGRFKVLELNGVGSEPLHIFDPNEGVVDAWTCSFRHWDIIYRISRINHCGVPFMRWKEAAQTTKHVMRIQRLHNHPFVIGN